MTEEEFKEITFDGFEQYRSANKEADYWIVDVRQAREYKAGHVPGARLIPLNTLGSRLAEIPLDKDLFFYCRSGARSEVAGIMAAESGRDWEKTYNITGGFRSHQGHSLEGVPRLQVFDEKESENKLLYQAMELEKAAERFYETILSSAPEEKLSETLEVLAKAEKVHARTIYKYWKETVEKPDPFEDIYGRLQGDILENGQPLSEVTAAIHVGGKLSWIDVIERALSIEIQAYDLYRSMADRQSDSTARDAFLSIAQMEKAHMKMVAGMVGDG